MFHILNKRKLPSQLDCIDDLESAAFMGLIKASRHWDESYIHPKTGRGVAFNTYAFTAIDAWITRTIEQALANGVTSKPIRKKGKLVATIPHASISAKNGERWIADDGGASDMLDCRNKDPVTSAANSERAAAMRDMLKRLFPRQRQVIELRFLCGLTLDEIAAKMNLSSERIRQVETQAIKRLRLVAGDIIAKFGCDESAAGG